MAVTLDTLKKTIGKKKTKSMAFAWLADYECMAGDVENALARVDAGLRLRPDGGAVNRDRVHRVSVPVDVREVGGVGVDSVLHEGEVLAAGLAVVSGSLRREHCS